MGSPLHSLPERVPAERGCLPRDLELDLHEFFARELGILGPMEIHAIDDLIVVRCKAAVSPAEISVGTTKAGRRLVKEVTEKVCKKLEPRLCGLLRRATGVALHELRVGLFWKRGEKIILLHMSDNVNFEKGQG